MRRIGRLLAAALSVALGAAAGSALLRVYWSWTNRVAVEGHSMEPTLRQGDWVLVDPDAYRARAPALGDLVVAQDPRHPSRVIVKRVIATDRRGHVLVAGDHPAHRAEALQIGRIGTTQLVGRPWLRYWPPARIGPV